jgi:hypothetical protein
MHRVQKQRPIIFIGHSRGGLVIKDVGALPGLDADKRVRWLTDEGALQGFWVL